MNTKLASKSMLMIAITLLGTLVVASNVRPAGADIGLKKAYGPNIGQSQPYEPVGPWIDGVLVPAYLTTQDVEWTQLQSGAIDVYDWAMRKSQFDQYTLNGCIAAPDAPGGKDGCPAGQGKIQNEIALANIQALDKYEIDFQNAKFPSNVQAFRWSIAWITDKESFDTNQLGGFGAPDYTAIACPILCQAVAPFQWVDQSLLSTTAVTTHVYGAGLPIASRIATANAILDAAGFNVGGGGVRVNNRPGCASDPGGCGAVLTPFFYVRTDDPERLALGQVVKTLMAGTYCITAIACGAAGSGLAIQMVAGCTGNSGPYPYANNYCETTRSQLRTNVFFNFNYNMYTAGWGLARDPTYLDDLYDSRFITPGNTNYVNFADPVFDTAARALRAATTVSNAISAAHAAEIEYNNSLPVIEVYTHQAPYAYRLFHSDPDPTLNGLPWEQSSFIPFTGLGYHNGYTWLNARLEGAPVHDPNHPVILKWGWKTDILDRPNPIDSDFVWDAQAFSLTYDTLGSGASDDLSFSGDLPWMASLPVTRTIASGASFPDGTVCTPDAPAAGCSVLSYQLRPDLHFAASLDGSIPAVPVEPDDVRFSILLGRDSPTSFISPAYIHVQNVVTGRSNPAAIDPATGAAMSTEPLRFLVEERNQAVWDRHDMAGTIVESVQHWCIEPHGTWAGVGGGSYTSAACNPAWPSGFPDVNVNVVGVGNGGGAGTDAFGTGAPAAVDMGSYAFVYDSQASSASAGPMLFRTRASPGAYLPAPYNQLHGCSPTSSSAPFLPAPYTGCAPQDGYFTNLQSSTATILPSSYDTGAVSGSSATFSGSAANIAISDSYSGSIACSAACNQGTTTSMTVTVTKVFRGVTLILTAPMTYGGAANPEWSTGHRWFAWAPAWGVWFGFEAEGNWQIIAGSPHFIGHVEEYQGINLWFMFWLAGNVNWICLATYPSCGGIDTGGPLPAPDMVVNIVDLAIVASHFGQTPGLGGRYGSQAWDISGSTGAPDGTVNIFDLTRVAIHFGQSFLGGTDIGGGTVGSMPGWMFDGVPNAANPAVSGPYLYPDIGEDCNSLACP